MITRSHEHLSPFGTGVVLRRWTRMDHGTNDLLFAIASESPQIPLEVEAERAPIRRAAAAGAAAELIQRVDSDTPAELPAEAAPQAELAQAQRPDIASESLSPQEQRTADARQYVAEAHAWMAHEEPGHALAA